MVDPVTGEFATAAARVLHQARVGRRDQEPQDATSDVEGELLRHMLEIHTDPATDLADVAEQLRQARLTAVAASEEAGLAVAATGTAPLGSRDPEVTADPRYERIVTEFGDVARGAGTCGMHVHVDIADESEGVRIIDGLRPWLPVLLALSANSPYAAGHDTGYASWRHQVWGRWPTAGPTEPYGSSAEYHRVNQALFGMGAALDAGMLYYDARLSAQYPTVEIRVADTCTEIDDALVVVALARALVTTCAAGSEPPGGTWRSELLRAAWWRASRDGLDGDLVHPVTATLAPANDVVQSLREAVDVALRDAGDAQLVDRGLDRLAATGTGARRQRAAFERTGDLAEVVRDLVTRSTASAEG